MYELINLLILILVLVVSILQAEKASKHVQKWSLSDPSNRLEDQQ